MRVTSELFVSALRRRAESAGAFAVITNKGAESAGAIFVVVLKEDRKADLVGPAPQSHFEDMPSDRLFERLLSNVSELEIIARLESEKRFDPDIWVVEIEDKQARCFVDLVEPDDESRLL